MKYLFQIALLLGIILSLVIADEKTIEGHWEGKIVLPGLELQMDVDFVKQPEGQWQGDLSIPIQQAKDIPLIAIVLSENSVTFQLSGIPGDPVFNGTFSDDGYQITGDFTQNGQIFSFEMKRADRPALKALGALADLDTRVQLCLSDFRVPGIAIAVVVEGEIILAKGYGYRDTEKQLPVTSQTLFAIGSTTKAFTSCIIGTLVDQGILDWDQPVLSYMPEFRLKDEYATTHLKIRDLLTHQSGLPRHDLVWYNSSANRAELVHKLRYLDPVKDLRESFHYQNLMYMTAGFLAEQVTKKSWESLVQDRIFGPIGMTNSNFSVEDSHKNADFALPYEDKKQQITRMEFRNISTVGPAGSINSNIDDMAHWMLLHLNEGKYGNQQILKKTTLQEMHTPQMIIRDYPSDEKTFLSAYGLGWMMESYQGHYLVHHGGNIDGFSAQVSLLPLKQMGIVILTNQNGSGAPSLLTSEILDRLLNLESGKWLETAKKRRDQAQLLLEEGEKKKELLQKVGTKPAYRLEEYVGTYGHPGYGDITVAIQNEKLFLTYNQISIPLKHWHYEVFLGEKNASDSTFEDLEVQFRGNLKGNVSEILLPFEPELSPIVFEKKADPRLLDPVYLTKFTGEYQLTTQLCQIELKGNVLVASLPGQPPYDLVPDQGTEFNLKALNGYSVYFVEDEKGEITELQFRQPNGVFPATRKK
ncbi:MAG: serine hydrolase [Planctomycetota bacterium]